MAAMVGMTACGGGSGSSSSTTPTTPAASNSVTLTAGIFPGSNYFNEVFTTVTICAPGTSTCQAIPNVLVDTGSVGLRIIASALTTLPQTSLGKIQDSTQDQLQECIQYGDTSYSWGPMWVADVEVGGEKASSVAVQVIGGNAGNPTFANVPSTCIATPVQAGTPGTPPGNEDTPTTFGANGVLGVGTYAYDCGSGCTNVPTGGVAGNDYTGYPYYICPTGGTCEVVGVPTQYQAVNVVAFFSSSDNNGELITLPSVPAAGAASVTGTMTFGVGTQSDNALPSSVTVYALNSNESIPTVTYNGVGYTNFNLLDSGSNTLDIGDSATLGIPDCSDSPGLYCPASTVTLSNIGLMGYASVGSGTYSLSIANADQVTSANPTFGVFSNIAGDGGTGPSNDYWDFGLPFFYGRTVYVGIGGTALPSGVSSAVTYGFFAF
jgi:hypothetical protein